MSGMKKTLTEITSLTVEEHQAWVRKIWDRMDRDGNGTLSLEELVCDEFFVVFRSILAPLTAGKGVAGYERSEINLPQALRYCIKKADANNDGMLDFREFESFLRHLRNDRTPEHIATVTFALFDLDCNNSIDIDEFREIYRYFLGHHPVADDLRKAWLALDVEGNDKVTKAEYTRWLRKRAGHVFTKRAPRVVGSSSSSEAGGAPRSRLKASPKKIHRPAPGLLPQPEKKVDEFLPIWNERFASKDPSEQNIAFRGNLRMKTMFSRPQSLPELHRFYCMHTNFEQNRRKLLTPEPWKKSPVLSTDNQMTLTLPGADRHKPGGSMKNSEGQVVCWQENTPRALIRPKWEPGALLLRVPGAPPAFLQKGRAADEDL